MDGISGWHLSLEDKLLLLETCGAVLGTEVSVAGATGAEGVIMLAVLAEVMPAVGIDRQDWQWLIRLLALCLGCLPNELELDVS